MFLGIDTHALSRPAFDTALEVLAANGVEVMIDQDDGYTPTPVISHAILTYNRGRTSGHSDGIVITPSHNPPEDGGIKYNPPQGGPADTQVTKWIEERANALLSGQLEGVKRVSAAQALRAPSVHRHDYRGAYVKDLEHVIDFAPIRARQPETWHRSARRLGRGLLDALLPSATGSISNRESCRGWDLPVHAA